jgi:NAD(P)H-quinone oxidoreductase subunit 5
VYRVCDVALLLSLVVLHHYFGSTELAFDFQQKAAPQIIVSILALLLVFSSLGKSAQLPFSFWLPRAIEGPTPSSAIFYGALSIHMGPYLLLRISPLFSLPELSFISPVIIFIGVATAAYGAFIGRTRTEVKTILAYASMSQVGLIFVEIGLGWHRLALFHIVAHMLLRTMQFLRSPMAIQDFQAIGLEQKRLTKPVHTHVEMLFPESVRLGLYRLALAGGHVEDILKLLVVRPFLRVAKTCENMEDRWLRFLNSTK